MAKVKKNGAAHTSRSQLPYHLMLAPGMLFLLLFHIVPMGGLIMAFQNYVPIKGLLGSDFVGLKNFQRLFQKVGSRNRRWKFFSPPSGMC